MIPALMLFLLCNLHVGCAVSINGVPLPEFYSLPVLQRAQRAAWQACNEIAPGEARLPTLEKKWRFSFGKPRGSAVELSHAIMLSTGDVDLLYIINVGKPLPGRVESGAVLRERLHERAYASMPPGAIECGISSQMTAQRCYTRSDLLCTYGEMLNTLLEASPLFYVWPDAAA